MNNRDYESYDKLKSEKIDAEFRDVQKCFDLGGLNIF